MREKFLTKHGSYLSVLFLFVLVFAATAMKARAATLYGVTSGNDLVRFNSATPGTLTTVGAITGLQTGENIIGIDFRPATGELYALGSNSRLYTINKTSGAAAFVAAISTTLTGTDFGFDFNPTVDRVRIVSNTGQNLRVNPTNGAATVDGVLNPGTPQVTAAGYTNSFTGATATTLYVIDSGTDTLYTQNPPNNGTLVPVGALGVDIQSVNGFDIFAGDGIGYLVAAPTIGIGTPNLYTVNLTTGTATAVGAVGGITNLTPLRGLAADSGTSASNALAYGLTTTNQIVRFNTARPGTLLATLPITGLQAGENLLAIDFRPATGQLYALGSTSRLYVINQTTGAAVQFGTAGAFTLIGTEFGFDFNPTVDRIRVVSDTGQNLRINPNDGTLTGTDTPLNPGSPQVTGAAYTNSFNGATATTLYDIDSGTDTLYVQNPPNNGTLVPVGALGVDVTGVNGFDITSGNNTAFAAFQQTAGGNSGLYTINLTSGTASFIGPIGGGLQIRGLALASSSAASRTLDFDGDQKTDYAFMRLSTNTWFVNRSSDNSFFTFQFGLPSDFITPGDYDGDTRTDISVWRPSTGVFYVFRSSDSTVSTYQFGTNGDEPVARDYDGDGKTDYAVIRRTGGQAIWYINNSAANTFRIEQFGLENDISAPGDYDGDGRFDLGVFRNGVFYTQGSINGFRAVPFGLAGDLVVPGDYDGDGKTDYAVLRQGTQYQWYVLNSSTGNASVVNFGTKPDFSTQGDYNGDGRTDYSVFRQSNGDFFVLRSNLGTITERIFGQNGDYPIANFDTH